LLLPEWIDQHHFIQAIGQDHIATVYIVGSDSAVGGESTVPRQHQELMGRDQQTRRSTDEMNIDVIVTNCPTIEIYSCCTPVEDLEPLSHGI